MRREPLLVEFLGLPGSGKTTTAHLLAETLRSRGIDVAEPSYWYIRRPFRRHLGKLGMALGCSVRDPAHVRTLHRMVRDTHPASFEAGLRLVTQAIFTSQLCRRAARTEKVTILEQGVFFTLWSMAYRSQLSTIQDRIDPENLLRAVPGPMMVWLVETDPGIAQARVRRREGRGVGGRPGPGALPVPDRSKSDRTAKALSAVDDARTLLRRAGSARSRRISFHTVRNDSPEDLLRNAGSIADAVAKAWKELVAQDTGAAP